MGSTGRKRRMAQDAGFQGGVGTGCRVKGFRVWGLGFRVWGLGFRV